MKNLTTLLILLIPILTFSQDYWTNQENNDYYYFATEIDPRNTFFTGEKETEGYNGTFKFGYKYDWFQAEVFHEIYPNIEYKSTGVNIFFIQTKWSDRLQPGAGLQLSVINRPFKIVPSFGANGQLTYHIGRFFTTARLEWKYRSDLKYYGSSEGKFSGYIGIGVKF